MSSWEGEDHARLFASMLYLNEGDVVELRGLGVVGPNGGTASGYFTSADKLVAAARSLDGRAKGLYVTLHEVDRSLLARASDRIVMRPSATTSDTDVRSRRWLLVDVDPRRASGISSTDAERTSAWNVLLDVEGWLRQLGYPEPLVCESGNGWHLLFRIRLAVADGGLIKSVLHAIAARFDNDEVSIDTSVYKAAQLTKLYGTLACKGDSTEDRPHRRSWIVRSPSIPSVVDRTLLEAVAAMAPTPEASAKSAAVGGTRTFDVDAFLARHGLEVVRTTPWAGGHRWVLAACPFNPDHKDRSAYVVQLANGALGAGCHHASCAGNGWREFRSRFEPISGPKADAPTATTSPSRTTPFEPFPTRLLPEPMRSFVVEGAQAIGCDESYIALPLLSTLGGIVGNTRRIRLKRTWSEPAVIWTVIVGWSGTQKSPALDLVTRWVHRREAKALRRFREKMAAHCEAHARYLMATKQWKQDGGLGDAPLRPIPPVAERLLCSDVTVEALGQRLHENPRGLLVVRDELSGWIRSFDAYKQGRGGDSARWLEIHRAGAVTIDRKTSEPPVLMIPRAAVSITGGIQPPILARVLGDEHFEDGLAARLLLGMPPRRVKRWTEADLAESLQGEVENVFERLADLEMYPAMDVSDEPVDIPLSPSGRQAWIEFYDDHARTQSLLTGNVAAAASKLEGYAARFALIVHLVRCAARDTSLRSENYIDEDSVAAGIGIVRWFGREAERIYALLGESAEEGALRALVEMIRARGGWISVRELRSSSRRYQTTKDAAEKALQALVDAGIASWEWTATGPEGGRPSRGVRLKPESNPDRDDETPVQSFEAGDSVSMTAGASLGDPGSATAGAEPSRSIVDPDLSSPARSSDATSEPSPPVSETETPSSALGTEVLTTPDGRERGAS